ncbi:hypothetical protein PENSPDRAFT_688370 [Peniophora sp. CONT]|nr:hypothetical protein PENSPDRAFT_688370 [Peniophora sp. CONT]
MSSMFASILCCCGSREHASEEPDENTRLIAPVDEPIPQPRHAVDSERMKERLGHIVRSKEGKMVSLQGSTSFAGTRSASRVSDAGEEHSQSASSLSAADPDEDLSPVHAPTTPSVRVIRGANRGRPAVRRISPSGLGASARAQEAEAGGSEGAGSSSGNDGGSQPEAGPSTVQPVGSLSASWGD